MHKFIKIRTFSNILTPSQFLIKVTFINVAFAQIINIFKRNGHILCMILVVSCNILNQTNMIGKNPVVSKSNIEKKHKKLICKCLNIELDKVEILGKRITDLDITKYKWSFEKSMNELRNLINLPSKNTNEILEYIQKMIGIISKAEFIIDGINMKSVLSVMKNMETDICKNLSKTPSKSFLQKQMKLMPEFNDLLKEERLFYSQESKNNMLEIIDIVKRHHYILKDYIDISNIVLLYRYGDDYSILAQYLKEYNKFDEHRISENDINKDKSYKGRKRVYIYFLKEGYQTRVIPLLRGSSCAIFTPFSNLYVYCYDEIHTVINGNDYGSSEIPNYDLSMFNELSDYIDINHMPLNHEYFSKFISAFSLPLINTDGLIKLLYYKKDCICIPLYISGEDDLKQEKEKENAIWDKFKKGSLIYNSDNIQSDEFTEIYYYPILPKECKEYYKEYRICLSIYSDKEHKILRKLIFINPTEDNNLNSQFQSEENFYKFMEEDTSGFDKLEYKIVVAIKKAIFYMEILDRILIIVPIAFVAIIAAVIVNILAAKIAAVIVNILKAT